MMAGLVAATIRHAVPEGVRARLAAAGSRWQTSAYRRSLARIPLVPSRMGVCVNYGRAQNTKRDGVIQGGRVKLLHLQRAYPEHLDDFNVLYLVSSAQPPFAPELVRWAKARGVKFVWNQNGVAYPAWAGTASERMNAPMRELLGLADYAIYQSEFCRASADRYLGMSSAPAIVLHNCVDTDQFRPATEPLPAEPWMLLAAGSHQQPERVWSVLETLAHLRCLGRNARLILAGRLDWPGAAAQTRGAIERLSLGNAVELVPAYTQEEAPALYRRAHVLLHTKYKDPCPTVVLEALSCGLPIIGSDSGGMPELVGNEAGVLVEVPDSSEKMHYPPSSESAAAIVRVMEDLAAYRLRTRQRAVEIFDVAPWLQRHRDIFSALLGHA